jgi:hypothetical protein
MALSLLMTASTFFCNLASLSSFVSKLSSQSSLLPASDYTSASIVNVTSCKRNNRNLNNRHSTKCSYPLYTIKLSLSLLVRFQKTSSSLQYQNEDQEIRIRCITESIPGKGTDPKACFLKSTQQNELIFVTQISTVEHIGQISKAPMMGQKWGALVC